MAKPTSTAAGPTKLWSIATSSGIDVIATRAAQRGADAAAHHQHREQDRAAGDAGEPSVVARIAIAMPMMPKRLPRRAVSWADRPAEAEDEQHAGDEVRDSDERFADACCGYFLNIRSMRCVTRKPPATLIVGDRMATAPSTTGGVRAGPLHRQHPADDDDAADRVGDAHERRVQRGRDVPDDLPADEARQHEHREVLRETPAARHDAHGQQRGEQRAATP